MKNILISGGSDGLGKALAKHFVQKYNVVILANDESNTRRTAEELKCDFVVADVSDYAQVKSAVSSVIEKYGSIDCLINNAGVWIEGKLEDCDPVRTKLVLDVNTLGTINLTHAVLPHMKNKKKGRIINVISQAGLQVKTERSVYSASKWAITGFTKSLQIELTGSGVSICGFYPGPMRTKLFEKAGNPRDMSKYMELSEASRAVEFLVETNDEILIPELGIKMVDY